MASAPYTNADTLAGLNGLYKQIYSSEGVQDLVPESSKLQKLIPFKDGMEKLGSQYVVPVILALENGITFGGNSGDMFDLNPPIAMQMGSAQVVSNAHILRSGIPYTVASRSTTSEAAFVNGPGLIMENMIKSMSRVIEIEMLYGQAAKGLGAVASVTGLTSTTVSLTFGQAEWAAGIWMGSKGLLLDLVNSSNSAVVNSTGALQVTAVNIASKTITVTGVAADVTAITTLYGASGSGFVTWAGSETKQFVGLNNIFQNVSGTLFNINAAQNELWQGNVFNVNANLTFDGIGTGLAQAQARGLDGDVELFVSPVTWKFLNDSAPVALRTFDKSYDPNEAKLGSKTLSYYTQSGVVNIHSHIYCKQGEAYAFNADEIIRVGSAPVGFNLPGGVNNDDIFLHAPNSAGFEVRAYGDEAILPLKPAACTLFTGITNS
jgi:hypothetical protein